MKRVSVIGVVALALMLTSGAVFADQKNSTEINTNAAIAGGAAAGVVVIGAGAVASTASAAVITSTIAAVGVGSMAIGIGVIAAVPILVGGGTYVAYRWISSRHKE